MGDLRMVFAYTQEKSFDGLLINKISMFYKFMSKII